MAPITGDGELKDVLIQVLKDTTFPVSVSLINTTLLSLLKRRPISEHFLLENQDIFSLQVIGSDLKISLRHQKPDKTVGSASLFDAKKICGIIENDMRKLESLKEKFEDEKKTEIIFNDLITNYSSKKRSVNMGFVVRNSNSLRIFSRDQETYVCFESEIHQLDDKEIFEILKLHDFSEILHRCLKTLLSSFSSPVQQGSLQSCFSLGAALIDKHFLLKYQDAFQGDGKTGIELRSECRKEMNKNKVVNRVVSPTLPTVIECKLPTPTKAIKGDMLKKKVIFECEAALKQGKSFVVVGESDKKPLIECPVKSGDISYLKLLKDIQQSITVEIQCLKDD